jgi:hypothetical protein
VDKLSANKQTHMEATKVLNVVGLKDILILRSRLSCCCELSLARFTGPASVAKVIREGLGFGTVLRRRPKTPSFLKSLFQPGATDFNVPNLDSVRGARTHIEDGSPGVVGAMKPLPDTAKASITQLHSRYISSEKGSEVSLGIWKSIYSITQSLIVIVCHYLKSSYL